MARQCSLRLINLTHFDDTIEIVQCTVSTPNIGIKFFKAKTEIEFLSLMYDPWRTHQDFGEMNSVSATIILKAWLHFIPICISES